MEAQALVVRGQVSGDPHSGARVRLLVRSLSGGAFEESAIAEAPVQGGRYEMVTRITQPAAHSDGAVLAVQLVDERGRPLSERIRQHQPGQLLEVDFDAAPAQVPEYVRIELRVRERLATGPAAFEQLEEPNLAEIAEWLELEGEHVELFWRSRQLERQTGTPAQVFYALGRGGYGSTLVELIDISAADLRGALLEAVERGLIVPSVLENVESSVERLCETIVDAACEAPFDSAAAGLGGVLANLGLPPDQLKGALRGYQRRGLVTSADDDGTEWLESTGAQPGEPNPELTSAIELASVLGCEPRLIGTLVGRRRSGDWQTVQQLTAYDFDDWCELVTEVLAEDANDSAELDGQPREAYVEEWAGNLLEAMEAAYPSPYIQAELVRSQLLSAPAQQLLERATDHDFVGGSLRERAASEPQLIEGLASEEAEGALAEVETIERLSRISCRAKDVGALRAAGVDSAHHAACISRRAFIDTFAESLGGRSQAARVHAQAQQHAAANQLAVLGLLQEQQPGPFVLRSPAPDHLFPNLPSLKELFGTGVLCDCGHCGSVYSPAAYLVDLLRYLDDPMRLARARDAAEEARGARNQPARAERLRYKPLDVLLARRPDLAEIPLTCENTLTPLPYIDLVNEVLEARVVGRPFTPDTGKVPADVLRAVPQNVDPEAYAVLGRAVYPLSLPFHEPLAVARAYLQHLGVSRLELMQAFTRLGSASEAHVAEALGTSLEALSMVIEPPTDLARHLGLADAPTDAVLRAVAPVPVFLATTGIKFEELVELLGVRFLNADAALSIDVGALDCDPDKARLAGLDAPRLGRMLQLLRLRRQLGLSFAQLDRSLFALGARDLSVELLAKLVELRELAKRVERPLEDLLILWAPFDTFGPNSHFRRLLQTRAVAWHVGDQRFALRSDGLDLATPGESLDPVAPALLAAFGITNEELTIARALQARRGVAVKLDVAGLSAVYRAVLLARVSRLSLRQTSLLLRLAPPDADALGRSDPATTRRFLELAQDVMASDFSPEQLAYLFLHETEPRRDPSPKAEQVRSIVVAIRRGLADALEETTDPSEATDAILRQKLALLLDPALLDEAVDVVDPRTRLSAVRRRDFFNRHLSRIFPDPAAAAERLFADAPATPAAVEPAASRRNTQAAEAEESDDVAEAASTPAPSPTPAQELSPVERRRQSNVRFVLDYLMPVLRTQRQRGAIIQVLADALSLDTRSVARLIEQVMRSARGGAEPLMTDFAALVGGGLSAQYFDNTNLEGLPVAQRTEPQVAFAWADGPSVDAAITSRFSVRFDGCFGPKQSAEHTFYVTTDGAVRLALTVDGTERVLLHRQRGTKQALEHPCEPIRLEAGRLYELQLEYRNQGAPASLILAVGTSPSSKQVVASTDLFPREGLRSFEIAEDGYRRLHKAALLLNGFGASESHLAWLSAEPRIMDLDRLPMQPDTDERARSLFQRWRLLNRLYGLRKKLPQTGTDLFDMFRAPSSEAATNLLLSATGWDPLVVTDLLSLKGFVDSSGNDLIAADEPLLLRLSRAVELQRRAGVSAATLFNWATQTPDAAAAAEVMQAVKARYDERAWLEVARGLNDPLRVARRDALVAYLLPRLRDKGVRRQSQLFEYFLLDVDMSPCMLTSRIRQAIGSVQTFFQRCLMSLEVVHPRSINDADWKYMKNYRVWEANRKIFLYPENWIEPELRDDKSPLFTQLEQAILQDEIKKENVEAAFAQYLEALDELAELDVRAVYFERRAPGRRASRVRKERGTPWDLGTYHVFARTFSPPHVWYYRRLERGRAWTPWEKVEADIEGDHLLPVIFHGRLHLFWTIFREVSKRPPPQDRDAKGPAIELGKDWEIQLAYAVYERSRWSRKRISEGGLLDELSLPHLTTKPARAEGGFESCSLSELGSASLSPSSYTLRANSSRSGVVVQLMRRALRREALMSTSVVAKWVAWLDEKTWHPAHHAHPHNPGRAAFAWSRHWGRVAPQMWLEDLAVSKIGSFRLDGCNGALRVASRGGYRLQLHAPSGYLPDATGFALAPRAGSGPLLTLPGVATPVLRRPRAQRQERVLPVVDLAAVPNADLVPLFIQGDYGCFFAQPVSTQRFAAQPYRALRGFLSFGQQRPRSRVGRSRPSRGRRESIEALDFAETAELEQSLALGLVAAPENDAVDLDPDVLEDAEDSAWHPEDADERAPRRHRRAAPRPAKSRPKARAVVRPPPRHGAPAAPPPIQLQARYRFFSFQHSHSCALLEILKNDGLSGLLQLPTQTHAPHGHTAPSDGGRAFRQLQPTHLVDARHPSLDLDFTLGSPYGNYNWELFFHAPLQIAVRLAKDGRHEEAQRWFHFIFDPTIDVSDPSPARYWRFRPLHEHNKHRGAHQLVELLSGRRVSGGGHWQQNVEAQLTAWQEQPFSPHVIARLRFAAYQKTVVMKYIDNLIEWGDKLFKQDTMESIQEATQLYVLAGNILGPKPERLPRLVDVPPTTFRSIRSKANAFSNWMVKFETSQVRRPFRVNARPDTPGVTLALRLETEYFCIPSNPQLEKYWDTVADRLYKICHCMNIQGVVRQLPLFEPPIDPALLVRAAAAGVDLGSVLSSLNAPPPAYRFGVLLDRAVRLVEELRSFGATTLKVLERRDAEALAQLRASNEIKLLQAAREIHKKHIAQVEMELAELSLSREEVELKIRYITAQSEQLMSPQEAASQASMIAQKVYTAVSEGIDLVSKVLYAIPDIQAGVAGGFSSPFSTFQLGGQMFGDISSAFASSIQKVADKSEAEAELADAQAEYQRRRAEWQHEIEVLNKEKAQLDKQIAKVQLALEIVNAELRKHDVEVENSQRVQTFLQSKYTNEQLYGWMLGQLATVHFQVYKVAFDAAQQAQRAYQFERGDASAAFIEFSYWDSLKKGLFAGERLLLDLRRLEAAHLEGDRRALEVTRHVCLRDDFPLALEELLASGRCEIDITEALLDGDFPGHYFRRLKTVALSAPDAKRPLSNVNCTLTLLSSRVRTSANASGNYAASEDGEDARFTAYQAPIQAVATSQPADDHGLFQLRFDDARYLPFEGAGAVSKWRIELRQADNSVDLSTLSGLVLSLSYSARSGGALLEAAARSTRERALARGGLKPEAVHRVSLRHDLPELWQRLAEAKPGQEAEASLLLSRERLSPRYRNADVRIESVVAIAQARTQLRTDSVRLRLEPPKLGPTQLTTWIAPWSGSKALKATADLAAKAGEIKVGLSVERVKATDVLDDLVLCFELRVRPV
jgi:hypothetical protein